VGHRASSTVSPFRYNPWVGPHWKLQHKVGTDNLAKSNDLIRTGHSQSSSVHSSSLGQPVEERCLELWADRDRFVVSSSRERIGLTIIG
jgi:hypothetical protein